MEYICVKCQLGKACPPGAEHGLYCPERPNLANASAIKDAANAKAMGKLVELADRVQAIRRQEDTEDYMASIDYLEDELKGAYASLKNRVGQHRADEIVSEMLGISPR